MLRKLARLALAACALALLTFVWHCDRAWFDKHVFLPQQFFIVASPKIVFGARTMAVAVAALLLLVAIYMPRGASARRAFAAVLLAIVAAEGLLQWGLHRLLNLSVVDGTDQLTAWNPRYGLTLRTGMDRTQSMSGRTIRFRTDAEGRRVSGTPIDPELPSLVFTGESTVSGMGLQWDETFPAILGSRLHTQVVNLASQAYRLDQSWLRLRDGLAELEHPIVVIGFFTPGLIGRSFAGQSHPPVRPSAAGGVELLPLDQPGILQRSGLYRLWKHLYWSDTAIDEGMRSVSTVMRDMAALAKSRGAPCIFVVTGHTPRWLLRELFDLPGLDYVAVEVLEEELLADSHPGPRGSRRIADALEARVRTRMANW